MADSFSSYDQILNEARQRANPWSLDDGEVAYTPDVELLARLLTVPISAGEALASGVFANALDAWLADELRRAGFGEDEVWPRRAEPRVISADAARVSYSLEQLERRVVAAEARRDPCGVMMPSLRQGLFAIRRNLPGAVSAHVLGRFYKKQIDVLVRHAELGPALMISGKTMASSFEKNTKNRFEEAVGDGANLKARFPLAPLGYVMLVRDTVFSSPAFYPALDTLVRSVQTPPEGRYDAGALVVVSWTDPPEGELPHGWSPDVQVLNVEHPSIPSDDLDLSQFMRRLLVRLFDTTPDTYFVEARRRWGYIAAGVPLSPPAEPV